MLCRATMQEICCSTMLHFCRCRFSRQRQCKTKDWYINVKYGWSCQYRSSPRVLIKNNDRSWYDSTASSKVLI